jgi:hypothetical protein
LAGALGSSSTIDSGFPTTTAAALASLTTGVSPGQHGLVGYSVLDAANDRVVNELSGWDERLDPLTWQLAPTVFEIAGQRGIRSAAVGQEKYRDSGFTKAVLRGAEYLAGSSIADRFDAALEWMRAAPDGALLYIYVPELDQLAHAKGWQSAAWTDRLEQLDGAVRDFVRALGPRVGLIVTADHGIVDVPQHSHVLVDSTPALLDGLRFIAGEPRCLQLHFEQDASEIVRESLVSAWKAAEAGRSWVATRAEAIAAGWFGAVKPEVELRIGDVLVAARKAIAYYDGRSASVQSRAMVGQHGSWAPAELRVPVLRFGAFSPL